MKGVSKTRLGSTEVLYAIFSTFVMFENSQNKKCFQEIRLLKGKQRRKEGKKRKNRIREKEDYYLLSPLPVW